MSEFVTREEILVVASVRQSPGEEHPVVRDSIDRSFELPTGLYAATVGIYLAFLAVMSTCFMNPSLAIPMAVIVLLIVAAFAVPTLWVRMSPENRKLPLTWGNLRGRGIETGSGHLDGGAAVVQVLILPVLILFWGLSVAVIYAFT